MSRDYWVVIDGKPAGPFHENELAALNLSVDSFVKSAGMKDYQQVGEIAELCELLGFENTNYTLPQYYAAPDSRMLASVIDYFFILLLDVIVLTIIMPTIHEQYLRIAIPLSSLLFLPLIKLLAGVFFEASAMQGTPGKYWLRLTVTDDHGRRITIRKSIIRNLCKILSLITLTIGYWMAFLDKRHRALHDRLAGTLVVKQRLI